MNDSEKRTPLDDLRKLMWRFVQLPGADLTAEQRTNQHIASIIRAITRAPELIAELAAVVEKHDAARDSNTQATRARRTLCDYLGAWDGSAAMTKVAIDLACELRELRYSHWANAELAPEGIEAVRGRLNKRAERCDPRLPSARGEALARELCEALDLEHKQVSNMFSRL